MLGVQPVRLDCNRGSLSWRRAGHKLRSGVRRARTGGNREIRTNEWCQQANNASKLQKTLHASTPPLGVSRASVDGKGRHLQSIGANSAEDAPINILRRCHVTGPAPTASARPL